MLCKNADALPVSWTDGATSRLCFCLALNDAACQQLAQAGSAVTLQTCLYNSWPRARSGRHRLQNDELRSRSDAAMAQLPSSLIAADQNKTSDRFPSSDAADSCMT